MYILTPIVPSHSFLELRQYGKMNKRNKFPVFLFFTPLNPQISHLGRRQVPGDRCVWGRLQREDKSQGHQGREVRGRNGNPGGRGDGEGATGLPERALFPRAQRGMMNDNNRVLYIQITK